MSGSCVSYLVRFSCQGPVLGSPVRFSCQGPVLGSHVRVLY